MTCDGMYLNISSILLVVIFRRLKCLLTRSLRRSFQEFKRSLQVGICRQILEEFETLFYEPKIEMLNIDILTITSCLPNWRTMVSMTWLCSGLKATFLATSNLSNSIKLALPCKQLSVVYLKVRFQACPEVIRHTKALTMY